MSPRYLHPRLFLRGLALWILLLPLLVSSPAICQEDARASAPSLKNPVPLTEEALTAGRRHYLRHCQICHGLDGRALENVDFEAADLTAPDRWRFGSTEGDIFVTTRDGAGLDMPPFKNQLEDEEIWQVVHYLRSIGPDDQEAEQQSASSEDSQ